ncbi:hypothetical protein FRX31_014881 [Thalictrum thalictroides]|uniref:Uncharacterized protein n=1 Tax=Thalictrum thalictroides TaxID=46969 RepID=A0A7J6WF15_THATH|nr:hypothetical protein FRX31_014881 [Thalictrum thalictroides]
MGFSLMKNEPILFFKNEPITKSSRERKVKQAASSMSLGYGEKLSYKEDVDTLGISDNFGQPHVLQQKT